jgi:hypothetical protein
MRGRGVLMLAAFGIVVAGAAVAFVLLAERPDETPTASPTAQVTVPDDAVRIALASSSVIADPAIFPRSVGSQPCQIRGGGPYPGIVVPGTCRTEVESSGSSYVVRFVETWDASRFHFAGEPSSGELQHAWSFVVVGAGVVVAQPESGNFPPQYVQ